jgi:hypothetical protein
MVIVAQRAMARSARRSQKSSKRPLSFRVKSLIVRQLTTPSDVEEEADLPRDCQNPLRRFRMHSPAARRLKPLFDEKTSTHQL